MIDCCPFSVSVSLIAHEVSGGREDYRNSAAFQKAEVQRSCRVSVGVFARVILQEAVGKPFRMYCVHVCVWFYKGSLVHIIKGYKNSLGRNCCSNPAEETKNGQEKGEKKKPSPACIKNFREKL